MKIYVRVFIVSLSWFILINFMSFGATVYAAASPSVGATIPFGSLPTEQKDPYLQALKQFLHDFFGLYGDDKVIYVDPDTGEQFVFTETELNAYLSSKLDDFVEGVCDEKGNFLYYKSKSTDSGPIPSNFDKELSNITNFICESSASNLYKERAGGRIPINSNSYSKALSDFLSVFAKDSFSIGMEIVNGLPSNVVNVKEDAYISVFDTLGLDYTVAPSLLDFQFNEFTNGKYISRLSYTPYFITSDQKLYLFQANIDTGYNGDYNKLMFSFFNGNNYSTTKEIVYNFHYPGKFSFRFVDNRGHLYFCLLSANYFSNFNRIDYFQYTYGRPDVSNAPLLFLDYLDGFGAPSTAQLNTTFQNNIMPDGFDISFVFSGDDTDVITDSAILSADIIAAGYLYGDQNTIRFNSSTLITAGQMLLSDENIVSGGDKTITSELSDWQKAIYVLAQQQGISFEELLSKIDLLIDSNGKITLLGLDGIEYSVSDLSKKFDEIIGSVGDISGDLSKLLEYLKSLNIEGLEGYISAIEGTLNDLNERDKDNSAVLGDCLGTLNDLKEHLDELDCAGVSANLKLIADSISHALELEDVNDIEGMDSSFIIDKFPFSLPFDLYHLVTLFVREPVKPIFTIPIETEINAFGLNEEINEEIVLDLTMFQINGVDIVQAVLRFSIIVGYVIMLLKLTTRFFV